MKFVVSFLTLCALVALGVMIFKPRPFRPSFPIIPLYATEDEARQLLEQLGPVSVEEPEGDHKISQHVLVATTPETRIDVGIWNGRVRYTNYLTDQFNRTDRQRSRKLNWFLDQLGGKEEFEEPNDTGYMLFIRNPKRKLTVITSAPFGSSIKIPPTGVRRRTKGKRARSRSADGTRPIEERQRQFHLSKERRFVLAQPPSGSGAAGRQSPINVRHSPAAC